MIQEFNEQKVVICICAFGKSMHIFCHPAFFGRIAKYEIRLLSTLYLSYSHQYKFKITSTLPLFFCFFCHLCHQKSSTLTLKRMTSVHFVTANHYKCECPFMLIKLQQQQQTFSSLEHWEIFGNLFQLPFELRLDIKDRIQCWVLAVKNIVCVKQCLLRISQHCRLQ